MKPSKTDEEKRERERARAREDKLPILGIKEASPLQILWTLKGQDNIIKIVCQ